jgi:hypothetical protein
VVLLIRCLQSANAAIFFHIYLAFDAYAQAMLEPCKVFTEQHEFRSISEQSAMLGRRERERLQGKELTQQKATLSRAFQWKLL